jgi:zinc protease
MIGFYDLPLDYLDTYTGKVRAVDRNDIRSVLNNRLDPERMVTVIVGNGG